MWSLLAAKPNLETAIHCNSSLANTDFASVIRQKGMSQIWQMELLFSPLAPIPREDPPTLPLSPAIVVLSLPSLRKTTTPPTDPLLFLLRNKALPGLGSTDCSGRSFLKDLNFFEKPRPWSSRDRTSAPRCPEHTSTILEGLQQAPKVWPTIDPRPGTQWPHVITIDRGGAAGSLMGLRLQDSSSQLASTVLHPFAWSDRAVFVHVAVGETHKYQGRNSHENSRAHCTSKVAAMVGIDGMRFLNDLFGGIRGGADAVFSNAMEADFHCLLGLQWRMCRCPLVLSLRTVHRNHIRGGCSMLQP